MKKTKIVMLSIAMSLALNVTSLAGEWKEDDVGWWYQNDDGSYISKSWFQGGDGTWYYFNSDGYMVTGWLHFTDTDNYYYFDADGGMRTEPLEENGITYVFEESGRCTNRAETQVQDMYSREALKYEVKYGYGYNQNSSIHKYSGVNLADENIVSYRDVAQSK